MIAMSSGQETVVGNNVSGKVIIITGSTGIAAETATLAAREGALVFIAGLDGETCRELSDTITAAGGRCEFLVADLTRKENAERVVEAAIAAFGRIDALYNVAGISGRKWGDGPVHECTEEGWDRTLETNLKTVFLLSRAVIRQLLSQEPQPDGLRGSVLNMASVLGFAPSPKFFSTHAYAASKGAIIGLTRSMAGYYAPHKIRVNAIAPSLVRTPMSQRAQAHPEILGLMKTKQPLAEDLMDARDIAAASLFLLGGGARMITGEVMKVDAGWCVSG